MPFEAHRIIVAIFVNLVKRLKNAGADISEVALNSEQAAAVIEKALIK